MPEASSLPERLTVAVPPVHLFVEGSDVYLLEVVKQEIAGTPFYVVSLYVEWNCWRSPKFHIIARSKDELYGKLKAEIAKFKVFVLTGATHGFTKIC